jgi:hypothetical protein
MFSTGSTEKQMAQRLHADISSAYARSFRLFSTQGIHALLFQLTVGGKIAFILINPILWVLTILYFTLNAVVG